MRIKVAKKTMKKVLQSKRTKATKTALTHFTLNAGIPTVDMSTDLITALSLIADGHFYWGVSSICFMFLPFAMKLGMLMSEGLKGNAKMRHLVSLILSIPFVNPLKQTLMALRLALIDPAKKRNRKKIEAVVKDASLNSLYEAILEAGPQLLIQWHIVLSTGEISTIQAISMCSSLFTLTLAASRGFFVQRGRKYADPEPSPQMVFWVFGPMLFLVLSSIMSWSMVGLIKEFICLVIATCVTVTWLSLTAAAAKKDRRTKDFDERRRSASIELKEKPTGKGKDETMHEDEGEDGRHENEKARSSDETEEQIRGEERKVEAKEEGNKGEGASTLPPPTTTHDDSGHGLCWEMGQCCKNFWKFFFCGVCCIFKKSARERAFKKQRSDWRRIFDKPSYLTRTKTHFLNFTSQLLDLTEATVESEDERYFGVKASLCSQWVPCIVGNTEDRTFPVSAAVSFAMRTLALLGVVLLATFNYPETFQRRTLLFYCQTNETLQMLKLNSTCRGWECFESRNISEKVGYKYRICNEDHTFVYVGTFVLASSNIVAVFAMFWLHHLTKNLNLYKISTCWPKWFPCRPIVHRSLVNELIEKGDAEELEKFVKIPGAEPRQDADGCSPINLSIRCGQVECLQVLLDADFYDITELDGTGMTPAETAVEFEQVECLSILLRWERRDVSAVDSQGTTAAQMVIEENQQEFMKKMINAKFKMPKIRAKVTSVGDEIEVLLNDKMKISKVDLPFLSLLFKDCEMEQRDLSDGGTSCLVKAAQDRNWTWALELLEAGVVMVRDVHGRLPISWHLGWDGLVANDSFCFQAGKLILAGQLDLLRILFKQLREREPLTIVGVSHQQVGTTALSQLMAQGADANQQEGMTILKKYGLTNLPPANFEEGKAAQLASAWNKTVGSVQITAEDQLWINAATTWLERGKGKLTGLKIKTIHSLTEDGNVIETGQIAQIQSLHRSQWSEWRDVGGRYKQRRGTKTRETELILQPGEFIDSVLTNHNEEGGLVYIKVTTTQGQEISAGRREKSDDKNDHPPDGKVLAYISGMCEVLSKSEEERRRARKSLTFHWENEISANLYGDLPLKKTKQ